MRILISGSRGLIGSALVTSLTAAGHDITPLVRGPVGPGEKGLPWDPLKPLDAGKLEGFDAIIHLAGESLAAKRLTESRKQSVWRSRVSSTRLLCETIARLRQPPKVLLSASATGFYGSCREDLLTEDSPPGSDFLAELCQAWEAATLPAADCGVRVVNLRFGVVLSEKGGALAKMLPPFRLGLGAVLGDGKQFLSWISLPKAISAIEYCLVTESLRGPVNVVHPESATQREFALALGQALGRPVFFRIPIAVLGVLLGKGLANVLLASQRVWPAQLEKAGFQFREGGLHPTLLELLSHG